MHSLSKIKVFLIGAMLVGYGISPSLVMAMSTTTPPGITPGVSVNMRIGARGNEVRNLQNFLKLYGVLAADAPLGYYGPQTAHAVKVFQKDEHIDSIGSVGPKTRMRIIAISKSSLSVVPVSVASTTETMTEAIMTTDVGEDGSGTVSSTTFASTTKTMFAVLTLTNVLQSTKIGYIRYLDGTYLDSGVTHPSRNGLRYIHIQWSLKPGQVRKSGNYQIRFYVNGNRAKAVSFSVQ